MTASTASTSSSASAFGQPHARTLSGGISHNNPGSEQDCDGDEDDTPKLDQPQGSRPSNQQQPLPASNLEARESHPELDEFVNEFYDGKSFPSPSPSLFSPCLPSMTDRSPVNGSKVTA